MRQLADRCYAQLREDPSLHFKEGGAVLVGAGGAVLPRSGVESGSDGVWFRIGSHAEHDRLPGQG